MVRDDNPFIDLRKRAEAALQGTLADLRGLSLENIQTLFHELQVHQIELELQNQDIPETARHIFEAHGGKIRAESAGLNQGTPSLSPSLLPERKQVPILP